MGEVKNMINLEEDAGGEARGTEEEGGEKRGTAARQGVRAAC